MAIFYVSPSGNDNNDGSINNPWKTPQKAADSVTPGSVVYFFSGTYLPNNNTSIMQISIGGTKTDPILFRPYENDTVIFDCLINNVRKDFGIYVNGASFITISNLQIKSSRRSGIRGQNCPNLIIENCVISDIKDPSSSVGTLVPGIYIKGNSNNAVITKNIVHDCQIGISLLNEGGSPVIDCEISKNLVYDIHYKDAAGNYNDKNSDGIQLNTCSNCIVKNNVIKQCGDDGIDCFKSTYCAIENNTIYNIGDGVSGSPSNAGGDGNGIKVSTGGGGGHIVRKNICFNCERVGFDNSHVDSMSPGNSFVYNNAYGNKRNGFIFDLISSTKHLVLNNISYLNNQDKNNYTDVRISNGAVVSSDYNFWGDGKLIAGEDIHSRSGNPLFKSPPLPGVYLSSSPCNEIIGHTDFGKVTGFELQPFSPCINGGIMLGSPPDIGAYPFARKTSQKKPVSVGKLSKIDSAQNIGNASQTNIEKH